MKKTIFITTTLILLLILGCRLEELGLGADDETVEDCMTFEEFYGDVSSSYSVGDMSPTADGNFIICGGMGNSAFLLKIDNEGETQFLKTNTIPDTVQTCKSIAIRPDGGFLICGEKKPIGGQSRPFFATYDADGNFQNQAAHYELGRCDCIIKAKDDGYVYAARLRNINNSIDGIRNTYVGRVALLDNTYYPQYLDGYLPQARPVQEAALSIIATSTGYAVAGRSEYTPGNVGVESPHFYLLNQNLELSNEFFYDYSSNRDAAIDIIETENNNFMLTGIAQLSGSSNVFALHVDASGETLGLSEYGFQGKQHFGNSIIKANEAKHYVIVGHIRRADDTYDIYLIKIHENGSLVWEKTFGQPDSNDYSHAVLPANDCGYIVAGQSNQNELGRPYIIKVDEDGNVQ